MPSVHTPGDVAERYGVGIPTVLHWLHSGQLRGINVARRPGAKKPRWRVTEAALIAFEEQRTPTPAAPRSRRRKADAEVIAFY